MEPYSGKIDAVFEGGGVKGIGLVGAVSATEAQGCTFVNVAGTSAGAIIAALVAADYPSAELGQILNGLDYQHFLDKDFVDKVPVIGSALSVLLERGIYEGRYFEEWLRELLARRNIHTFGDLVLEEYASDPRYRYRLQVIAADLTHCRMLVLPRDIRHFGMDPDRLDVARAVRMSMSIPFFFEPVRLQDPHGKDCYIVDGGMLSNFPVWLFDAPPSEDAEWPTIGFKLVEGPPGAQPDPGWKRRYEIGNPIAILQALFSTMMEAHDARYIEDREFARTIPIPTLDVKTTEFDLSPEKASQLYHSGRDAGEQFWQTFDFEHWKEQYRTGAVPSRRSRLL